MAAGFPFTGADGAYGPWLLCLGDLSSTAAPAWEMQEVTAQGGLQRVFVPITHNPALRWIVPIQVEFVEAFRFEWKSPQWCLQNVASVGVSRTGVVAGMVGAVEPWLSACARVGFGELSKTNLVALCRHLNVTVQDSSNLFDVSFALMQSVLQTSDADTVELMSMKVAAMQVHHQPCVDELLALDEGVCGFDKSEIQEMKKKKEDTVNLIREVDSFTEAWRSKKRVVCPPAPVVPKAGKGGRGTAGGRGRGRGGNAQAAARPTTFPKCDLDQVVLKPFCPAGGYLWKATGASWQCHFAPYPRHSFSWRVYGDRRAAMLALKQLWTDYNRHHGHALTSCPWPEVMSVDASLVTEPSGAAASSAR